MTPRATRGQALMLLAACAAVFLAGYQLTLRRALRLGELPGSAWAWDAWVPFWPASIALYCSIDVAYLLAFFVTRDLARLHQLAARLLAVQLICFACFWLWPMRLEHARPVVDGAWGAWYSALASFDGASNLVPSLHVAILGVLWRHFRASASTRGARWACDAWALGVALSALTTWQHHVVDVLAGGAVAGAVMRCWGLRTGLPREAIVLKDR